ncbi:putative RiPP precursor [Devosia sp. Root105]|nr:putative RiPP precursor [Devosia sp. Root105]
MKKIYTKPALVKEQKLTAITAVPLSSKGSQPPQ